MMMIFFPLMLTTIIASCWNPATVVGLDSSSSACSSSSWSSAACAEEGKRSAAEAAKAEGLLLLLNEKEEKWSNYTEDEIWEKFGCDEVYSTTRPIHNESTWLLLRGAYQGIVGPPKSTIAPLVYGSGFHVQVLAQQSPGKGRGVFAAEKPYIPRGSLIWNTRQTARFPDGKSYRRFLMSIPTDLACDVIEWTYVQNVTALDGGAGGDDDKKEEGMMISVDLDPGVYMNTGLPYFEIIEKLGDDIRMIEGQVDIQNVGCLHERAASVPGGCEENYFALRDIYEGEELLCDYGEFAVEDGYEQFGLE